MAAISGRLHLRVPHQVTPQRHQGKGSIPVAPRGMSYEIVPQGADRAGIEHRAGGDRVDCRCAEVMVGPQHPLSDRETKAGLRAGEDTRGEQIPSDLPQEVFGGPFRRLMHASRQAGGILHESPREKRHAHLERMSHAVDVHVAQHRVGEIEAAFRP